jgi:hypothetical protein
LAPGCRIASGSGSDCGSGGGTGSVGLKHAPSAAQSVAAKPKRATEFTRLDHIAAVTLAHLMPAARRYKRRNYEHFTCARGAPLPTRLARRPPEMRLVELVAWDSVLKVHRAQVRHPSRAIRFAFAIMTGAIL